jgi:hypothetical protein
VHCSGGLIGNAALLSDAGVVEVNGRRRATVVVQSRYGVLRWCRARRHSFAPSAATMRPSGVADGEAAALTCTLFPP